MRLSSFALVAILAAGCASPAEPHTNDVAFAHAQWLALHPSSYSFNLWIGAFASIPGPIHITVANGQMTSALDPTGTPLQLSAITIDGLWARILSARQNGTLNSAEFSLSGVPTDVDMGTWANDGGVHYTVRNFAVTH
jgi:uncharacterized protein DUF6174